LLFAPVLAILTLGILAGCGGLGLGHALALAAGCRLPGCGAVSRLLEARSQRRQVLTKFAGQAAVGSADRYEYIPATLRYAHLHSRFALSGELQFDIVRGRGCGYRAGVRLRKRSWRLRFGGSGVAGGRGSGRRLDLLWGRHGSGRHVAGNGDFRGWRAARRRIVRRFGIFLAGFRSVG
jgi:hypothetical protein